MCPSCTCSSFVYSFFVYIPLFIVPLFVVPTDFTDYTEAYGFIFLESTERIDAARHTIDGTEMIACLTPLMERRTPVRRTNYAYNKALTSVLWNKVS